MIEFDENGFIKPYKVIETDLATIERIFVEEMPFSATRRMIFNNYLAYNAELKQIIPTGFVQWIDGSFITKKRNPNDIDLVTFIDFKEYEKNKSALENLKYWKFNKSLLVDGYILSVYPPNHSQNFMSELDKKDWRFRFGTSRNYENKGIIQLNFK